MDATSVFISPRQPASAAGLPDWPVDPGDLRAEILSSPMNGCRSVAVMLSNELWFWKSPRLWLSQHCLQSRLIDRWHVGNNKKSEDQKDAGAASSRKNLGPFVVVETARIGDGFRGRDGKPTIQSFLSMTAFAFNRARSGKVLSKSVNFLIGAYRRGESHAFTRHGLRSWRTSHG